MSFRFKLGDKVIKNPVSWVPSDFDCWGMGVGIGTVKELFYYMVDVQWPGGRSYHQHKELIPLPIDVDRTSIPFELGARVFLDYEVRERLSQTNPGVGEGVGVIISPLREYDSIKKGHFIQSSRGLMAYVRWSSISCPHYIHELIPYSDSV